MAVLAVGTGIQEGVRISDQVVSASEGLAKASTLVSKTIGLVEALSPLATGWSVLKDDLSAESPLGDLVGTVVDVEWFVSSAKKESWDRICGKVCLFVAGLIRQLKYLGTLEFIDLSGLTSFLGKVVDLTMIGRIFTIGGSAFGIYSEVKKMRQAKVELETSARKIAKWEAKRGDIAERAARAVDHVYAEEGRSEDFLKLTKENLEAHLTLKMTHRIEKWKTVQANATSQKRKSIIATAYNVASIALSILAIVGVLAGIALLGPGSLLILGLGVGLAAFGVFKYIDALVNKPKALPQRPGCLDNYKNNGDNIALLAAVKLGQ